MDINSNNFNTSNSYFTNDAILAGLGGNIMAYKASEDPATETCFMCGYEYDKADMCHDHICFKCNRIIIDGE